MLQYPDWAQATLLGVVAKFGLAFPGAATEGLERLPPSRLTPSLVAPRWFGPGCASLDGRPGSHLMRSWFMLRPPRTATAGMMIVVIIARARRSKWQHRAPRWRPPFAYRRLSYKASHKTTFLKSLSCTFHHVYRPSAGTLYEDYRVCRPLVPVDIRRRARAACRAGSVWKPRHCIRRRVSAIPGGELGGAA
jgi:hypothetical protein